MRELEIVREKIQNKYRVVKTDEDLEWNRAIDLCTNIINAHMKHMNDGWIPVEENLPAENKTVLVCQRGGAINVAWHDGYRWKTGFSHADWLVNVIAWRPLPEPYRPERSDGE